MLLFSLQFQYLFAQNPDIRELSENELFRREVLSEEIIPVCNQTWEEVSLSLLVKDVEAAAEKAGLDSFSVNISEKAINIIYRDIRFLPGSSDVTPETKIKILKLAEILKRFSGMGLLVQGHTARLFPEDSDAGVELSADRAASVAAIIADTGIFHPEQIAALGRGYYKPLADNSTPEGRALNRRVEISIIGSVDRSSRSDTVWWDFFSSSMSPGYTVFLLHDQNKDDVEAALESAGFSGLVCSSTSKGIGILDNSMKFNSNNAPDPESIKHLQRLSKLLLSMDKNMKIRIGGYGDDIPAEQSEERHFLTSYTLVNQAGILPENIIFSKAPYMLVKASAELETGRISTPDGLPVEFEGSGSSFTAVVPYSVDSLVINLTPSDPLAEIYGISTEPVPLFAGKNELTAMVESAAGFRKISKAYTLTVFRKPAELKSLTVEASGSPVSLTPEFSADIWEYQAEVPYEVEDLDISASVLPEEEAAGAIINIEKGYSDKLTVGRHDIIISLSDGSAEDKVYTLSVVRESPAKTTLEDLSILNERGEKILLSPPFSSEVTLYQAEVPYSVNSVSITAIPTDDKALLDTPSDDVLLGVGENSFNTSVATQNRDFVSEYKVIIKRSPPLLKTLTLTGEPDNGEIPVDPLFTPQIKRYSASVPYKTKTVKLDASLDSEDLAAGASLEIISGIEGELPVGQPLMTVRVTDAEGNTCDYEVEVSREEKTKLSFDICDVTLIPEWYVTPSAAFYTNGFGFKGNGGVNLSFADEAEIPTLLKPLRLGAGGHLHWGSGNYISIFSCGGFLSTGYAFPTGSFLDERWYFPVAFVPRIEAGVAYVTIDHTDGRYHKGAAFYLSPALRTDFVFPAFPDVLFGLDFSYVAYICSVSVDYLSLGLTVAW